MKADLAIELLLALLVRAGEISTTLAQARAESRDITAGELDRIVQADDDARSRLAAAIARARAEGR